MKFCLPPFFFCEQSLSHSLWIYLFSLLYFQPFIYWVTAFFHTPHTVHMLCWPQWYNNIWAGKPINDEEFLFFFLAFLNSHSRPFVHILRGMWVGRCSVVCIPRTHHTAPIKYALVLKTIWLALQLLQCGLRHPPAMNFGLKLYCFHRFHQCLHLFNDDAKCMH